MKRNFMFIQVFIVTVMLTVFPPPISCKSYYLIEESSSSEELEPRIVGGRPAVPGEAYYQLLLMKNNYDICGATLVLAPTTSRQIAITAAHCVCYQNTNNVAPAEEFSLRGGTINRSGGQVRQALEIIPHEEYIDPIYSNDIAIIFFDPPFDLNKHLKPLSLPPDSMSDKTDTLTVSGWGRLTAGGHLPKTMQILTMPVISNRECAKSYKDFLGKDNILKTQICAGFELGGYDSCQGDSGGPARGKNSRGIFLAGVVSFGRGCGQELTPGVYARVSKYLHWIDKLTRRVGGCKKL